MFGGSVGETREFPNKTAENTRPTINPWQHLQFHVVGVIPNSAREMSTTGMDTLNTAAGK
jgi:hypothetical protein